MKEYKVLNLYACLGGNRYKWNEVAKKAGYNLSVTAVEYDPELAKLYQERFPADEVIVSDAHEYLRLNYKKFDFIWSSPPCPSHSRARFWGSKGKGKTEEVFPDFRLYEEIVFLDNFFDGKYIVENVIPYYEPLLNPKKRNRHLYWCNFYLPNIISDRDAVVCQGKDEVLKLCEFHQYNFYKYKGEQRLDKIARNLVDYEAGKTIFETVLGIHVSNNINQTKLF